MSALFKKKTENKKPAPLEAVSISDIKNEKIPPHGDTKTSGADISWEVIDSPHYSEKANLLEAENKYVFIIKGRKNKNSIKQAISKAYNVTVLKVNILRLAPKIKPFRGVISKRPARVTKAIVTIKEGQKINLGAK